MKGARKPAVMDAVDAPKIAVSVLTGYFMALRQKSENICFCIRLLKCFMNDVCVVIGLARPDVHEIADL